MDSIEGVFSRSSSDWSTTWGFGWASANGRWGQQDAKQRLADKRGGGPTLESPSTMQDRASTMSDGQGSRNGMVRDPNRTSIMWDTERSERGLSNELGANHCFLNVAIQTFWNIRTFRERFLREPEHTNCTKSKIDDSLAAAPAEEDSLDPSVTCESCNPSEAQGNNAENCCFCALKSVLDKYQFSDEEALPPDTLRNALASSFGSKGRFRLGEMEDATETIEALLDVFHAHTVYEQAGYWQLTLDAQRKGKIRERMQKASAADLAEEAAEHACSPMCISHEVFGIEYVDLTRCTFCGATGEPSTVRSFLYPVYVADLLRLQGQSAEGSSTYALMQARIQNYAASFQTSTQRKLPDLLRQLCQRDVEQKCNECQSLNTMVSERWLTKWPIVLVFSMAWPSATPSKESLWQTLSTIQPLISMDQMFRTEHGPSVTSSAQPSSADASLPNAKALSESYFFRGMICFYGCHYVSFFWCWAKMKWTLFDDTRIKEEKDWSSVVQTVIAGQYVPTLLFYELNDGTYDTADIASFVQQVSNVEDRSNNCCTM